MVTPRTPSKAETYQVQCWRCQQTLELAVSLLPYRCLHCGALLLIEWRSVRKPRRGADRVPINSANARMRNERANE
jgi:hypothetical protein